MKGSFDTSARRDRTFLTFSSICNLQEKQRKVNDLLSFSFVFSSVFNNLFKLDKIWTVQFSDSLLI